MGLFMLQLNDVKTSTKEKKKINLFSSTERCTLTRSYNKQMDTAPINPLCPAAGSRTFCSPSIARAVFSSVPSRPQKSAAFRIGLYRNGGTAAIFEPCRCRSRKRKRFRFSPSPCREKRRTARNGARHGTPSLTSPV